jgi:O-antigen ligase
MKLAAAAEALFLAALAAGPWMLGGAPDPARYGLCAVLLLAGALWAASRGAKGWAPVALAAAGLPLLALLQVALGRSASWVWTLEAALVAAAVLGAAAFWADRGRDARAGARLVLVLAATALAQAAFAAVQWSLAPDRVYGRASPFVTTPFGSYVNHNHFAGFVEMAAVAALGAAVAAARRDGGPSPRSLVLGGTALGLAATHLASRSRGGLLALAAGLVALGALMLAAPSRHPRSARSRAAVVAMGLLLVLAFGLASVPASTRGHLATALRGATDASGEYRVDVARDTLRLAAQRPLLGWGLGAYADAFTSVKRGHGDVRTTHAESDVLEFLAEAGLGGLAVLGVLGFVIGRGLRARVMEGRDPWRKGLAIAAAGGAAALLAHSWLDFNLRLPANALVFASLLGLCGAPRDAPQGRGGRAATRGVAAVFALLALAAGWRAAGAWAFERAAAVREPQLRLSAWDGVLARHPYLSDAWRERATLWWALSGRPGGPIPSRLARAEHDLRRAVALRPRWAEAWADLGWVLHARGETKAAREAFDRAHSSDPTHPGVRSARAAFLAATGGPERARVEPGRE